MPLIKCSPCGEDYFICAFLILFFHKVHLLFARQAGNVYICFSVNNGLGQGCGMFLWLGLSNIRLPRLTGIVV